MIKNKPARGSNNCFLILRTFGKAKRKPKRNSVIGARGEIRALQQRARPLEMKYESIGTSDRDESDAVQTSQRERPVRKL